ncbi:Hypothetical protein CINCED_3A021709 [Cinara cedri]|uniref:Uncharacterized protein n=1 Tax=Cinara cedri TaxID=506608 RepID=A0A5E4MEG1_9HEMI|nr:Hypothetical protein CINCED_3A021709 [Cinara cedri]
MRTCGMRHGDGRRTDGVSNGCCDGGGDNDATDKRFIVGRSFLSRKHGDVALSLVVTRLLVDLADDGKFPSARRRSSSGRQQQAAALLPRPTSSSRRPQQ